jgi:hypothetical protein
VGVNHCSSGDSEAIRAVGFPTPRNVRSVGGCRRNKSVGVGSESRSRCTPTTKKGSKVI